MRMCAHNIFIHLSTDVCLGYFHILAIVSSDLMNLASAHLFKLVFLFALGKYSEVGLLDYVVFLFLIF